MSDQTNLLAHILANPDDEVARLVYADSLEENDAAGQAEFIRAQCALARLTLADPRRSALEDRADELLGLHREEWLGPPPPALVEWKFERGFVQTIVLEDQSSLEPVRAIFARHPVRQVDIGSVGEELADLAESPFLEGLSTLRLRVPLDSEESAESLETLLTSPALARLEGLSLWGDHGGENCLPFLRRRPGAERLAELELDDLSDRGAGVLVEAPELVGLTGLRICPGRALTDAGLAALLCQPGRWRALEPIFPTLTPAGFNRLFECDRLERLHFTWPAGHAATLALPAGLRELEIEGRVGQPARLGAVRDLACLPNLKQLRLQVAGVGDGPLPAEEVAALGEVMARLSGPVLELVLDRDCLSLADLLQLPGIESLRSLTLRGRLRGKDLRALAKCARLAGLHTLHLPGSESRGLIRNQIRILADAPVLDRLRTLSLRGLKLNEAAVSAIFQPGRLPYLRQVWLNSNAFGRAGVEALLAWGGLPRMEEIFLSENQIDAAGARLLLGPGGVSPLTRLYMSEYGEGSDRFTRETAGPFHDRHGRRFTLFER